MPKNYLLHLRGDVGNWNFNSSDVNRILDQNKDTEVNVLINSLGGRVDTALTISSLFALHGNVHVHFIGMNASAATIAAMGAKRVTIDASACFLVHKCLNLVFEWDYMNADELEAHIAKLQKMKDDQNTLDTCIAGIYAKRCKKPTAQLLSLMKVGGWLTPQQAKDWGFVDEITDFTTDEKPVLTDAIASVIFEAGLPLPPVGLPHSPIDLPKETFFERLRRFFTDTATPHLNTQPSTLNQSPMNSYTLLAAILGCAVAVEGTGLTLTADQLDKIENALKEKSGDITTKDTEIATLRQQITDKDTQINTLNQTVADLTAAPAASTTAVTEQARKDAAEGPGSDIDDIVNQLATAYRS